MVEGRTYKPVIDQAVCGACGVCEGACPAEVITEYRDEKESVRGALYSGGGRRPRGRERKGLAPCREACPVGLDTGRYVRLISEGAFLEALDAIRERLPFPGTMGRICHHPCEQACLKAALGEEPVSLCGLKAFAADYETGRREVPVPRQAEARAGKVAVIGGGPSGMACALFLKARGFGVTIFEASRKLGGMLYWAVPAFRLPREVLARETSVVEKAGIEVRYGTLVGRDIPFGRIREGFDAVFVGCGAQEGAGLGLENEDAAGVTTGLAFLREAGPGKLPGDGRAAGAGGRVVVVGGGNVAVDAAITARMRGAKEVIIVCLEKRAEMAAAQREVAEALRAGVKVRNGWGPKRIIAAAGKAAGVEVRRCVSVFDGAGEFHPVYKEAVTRTFDADAVIVAVGQAAEIDFLKDARGLALDGRGWVKTDPDTLRTCVPGIFAGGDVVTGPGMAIDAVAAGIRAAASIEGYLSEKGEARHPGTGGPDGTRV